MTSLESAYEAIPYSGKAFAETHPDHMGTVAALLGVEAPCPDDCRVLEIGCGDGSNLIPMAEALPQSTFIGIDLGRSHIEKARHFAEVVGLQNITFHQLDIADFDREEAPFDYIICHGVYSWVPPQIQERILEICARQLTPNGIAYVSHNALPGWHMRGMVRDMAAYAKKSDGDREPQEDLRHARALVENLADQLNLIQTPYAALLKAEFELANQADDHYFYHEYLAEYNEALYLYQFIDRARAHGLNYLADSELCLSLPGVGDPGIENLLQSLSSNRIDRQQYADFLFNRPFRRTLLCHTEVTVTESFQSDRLSQLHASTNATVSPMTPGKPASIQAWDGTSLGLPLPLVEAAFRHLASVKPASLTVDQLLRNARRDMQLPEQSPTDAADRETLSRWLLTGQSTTPTAVIDLHRFPDRFAHAYSTTSDPVASPVVRFQCANGAKIVTNRRHESKSIDALYQRILIALDGKHSRSDLEHVVEDARQNKALPANYGALGNREIVEIILSKCTEAALLVGP